jgi:hypothetical protein
LDFAAAGFTWPQSGLPITPGSYILRATVLADDGRTLSGDWFIEIE